MSKKTEMKQYRIGDYARYMGVTPDFLKHYEQYGLITPIVTDSGYRYYPFNQSPELLSCMGLRSYGIPVKEMSVMLHEDSLYAYQQKLEERAAAIRRQIEFEQALLKEHERLMSWMRRMEGKTEDWHVDNGYDMLFLPHSNLYTFVDDSRVYDVLGGWIEWMPMVKSCLAIRKDAPERESPYCWGLCVRRDFGQTHGLPINDAVQICPAHKRFVYSYKDFEESGGENMRSTLHQRFLDKLSSMNLSPIGDLFMVVLTQTHEHGKAVHCGYYIAEIE